MTTCPSGFVPNLLPQGTCVPACPTQPLFRQKIKNGATVCEYAADPSVFFQIPISAPQVGFIPTVDRAGRSPLLSELSPSDQAAYQNVQSQFDAAKAVAIAGIEQSVLVRDAFRQLQEAENARDASPEAYESARANYYTLLRGSEWANEEAARVARADLDPKVAGFVTRYEDLQGQLNTQQQLLDVTQGVKDKVVSLRDDFRYSVNTFGKQIRELQNQIAMERVKRVDQVSTATNWIDWFLNVLLVIVLLYAAVVLIRRFMSAPPAYTSTASTMQ